MELINPRTFLVVALLLGLLCALVLFVEARSYPKDIVGLDHWAGGVVLVGIASGLLSLRDIAPDLVAIVLANALMLAGNAFLIVGLQLFSGRPATWRPMLDGIAAVVLLIFWLTYGTQSYPGRIFVMAIAQGALFAWAAALAARAEPRGFGSKFLAGAFMFAALAALWRVATLPMSIEQASDVFDRSLVQQVYLGAFSLGLLGLAVGFILLANEKLRVALEFLATRDPMTGALNRRAFFTRAEVEWARAQRSHAPLAAIASDIDFFKKVNDTFGHHVGDLVIKDYANRSAAMLRKPDILARFGGEEFVILLPDTGLAEARQVAERIRRDIEAHRDKALPPFTVSLGISVTRGTAHQPATLAELLSLADEALYRAKQAGRNRTEV